MRIKLFEENEQLEAFDAFLVEHEKAMSELEDRTNEQRNKLKMHTELTKEQKKRLELIFSIASNLPRRDDSSPPKSIYDPASEGTGDPEE